jgi:hypothetical protein
MNRTRIRGTIPGTHQTRWPSLIPCYMVDTALTLADIPRDRALDPSPDKR